MNDNYMKIDEEFNYERTTKSNYLLIVLFILLQTLLIYCFL